MAKTISFVVLLGFYGFCYSQSFKSRLDFLEMQVSREAFKTRSDIIELRDLIASMNGTGPSIVATEPVDNSAIEIRLNKLDEKLESFMHDQQETTLALSKAITEEKAVTRKMLKIMQDLADSNTESVLEIEQAVEQSEIEREMFKEEWKVFEEDTKSKLSNMRNNSKILHEKFENFDGNIIIRNEEKKAPCPKTWFRDKNICYLYQKQEKLSWYGSRIRCYDLGGKLAEPDTVEKMFYVLKTIDGDNVWIGATDQDQEGKWVWASSQKQLDSNVPWQHNQPNNLHGNQHCMEIGLSSVNDESCFEENYYVCEKQVSE